MMAPASSRAGRTALRHSWARSSSFQVVEAIGPPTRVAAREVEDLLDHLGEPAGLVPDDASILLHSLRVGHDAVREVLPGGADHRHRGAELVRHAGHELELALGQAPRPLGGDHDQDDTHSEESEDQGAHRRDCAGEPRPRPGRRSPRDG